MQSLRMDCGRRGGVDSLSTGQRGARRKGGTAYSRRRKGGHWLELTSLSIVQPHNRPRNAPAPPWVGNGLMVGPTTFYIYFFVCQSRGKEEEDLHVVTEDLVVPSPSALNGYWADYMGYWLVSIIIVPFLLRAHHVIFIRLLNPSRFLEMMKEKRLLVCLAKKKLLNPYAQRFLEESGKGRYVLLVFLTR
ncbi:hypothetical protein LX36DRAFT_127 [Colletotrichum falcatum]|nr:hypothetical protein LX36DRAFT_127 [Colletotrichum falcatum]